MYVYCYHDPYRWGEQVAIAVHDKKGSAEMCSHPMQVPDQDDTVVFMHRHNPVDEPSARHALAADKFLRQADFKKARIVPSRKEIAQMDDRIAQWKQYAEWMPTTSLYTDLQEAVEQLNTHDYPLVSKSQRGIFDRNIRIIDDPAQGFSEIMAAFQNGGIPLAGDEKQQGYLLWQQVIHMTGRLAWRVIIIGKKYGTLIRMESRNGEPKFSGVPVLAEYENEVMKFAYAFVVDNDLDFAMVDVLLGIDKGRGQTSPFITAVTCDFPIWYLDYGSMIFEVTEDYDWMSTGTPGVKMFDLIADMLMKGEL